MVVTKNGIVMEQLIIKKLKAEEVSSFQDLIRLFLRVFEEESLHFPGEAHLQKLLSNSSFHVFIAEIDGQMVGGFTAYELMRYYSEKSELYLYDIAVETEWHNRGIGKKLMAALKAYGAAHQIEAIFVQAVSEEAQAVKFYESTIGPSEKVDYFNFDIPQ